jgi:hypothetical protein
MWNSEHFGLSRFKSVHQSSAVKSVILCAYTNIANIGDENGRPPTNHWAMFLKLSNTHSVKLDMIPGDGSDGLTGMLIIESKEYVHTNKAIHMIQFTTQGDPIVDRLVKRLIEKGRDRYKFTDDQEGCRYWNYMAIHEWETAGLLAHGTASSASASLSYYYAYPTGKDSNAMEEGTFY